MSKIDATDALHVYKGFIKQTDRVVDYLGMARRLHNVLNVPVPNLKHAPTGLAKALDEYLNDPDFESNRMEYKASLGVVEGKPGAGAGAGAASESNLRGLVLEMIVYWVWMMSIVADYDKEDAKASESKSTSAASNNANVTSASTSTPAKAAPSSPPPAAPAGSNQKIQDFFDSIQADQQPTMFGGPAS